MVSSEYWFGAKGFYNDVATQSLRFDYGSDPNLNINHGSTAPTLNTKGTISFWIKRGVITNSTGNTQYIIHTGTGTSDSTHGSIQWETTDVLSMGGYSTTPFVGDRKLRDTASWYHILLAFDSTSSTASERYNKIYINGEEQNNISTNKAVAQDEQFPFINANQDIYIGRHASVNRPLDSYLAEFNIIDGQALTPSSFGETKNGVWIPIKYTGSYGNNGVRLQFNQTGTGTASASTIGADTSGNNNHFTSSGIVASDCNMPDSPENNFATLNPLSFLTDNQLENGNLELNHETTSHRTNTGTMFMQTGKWYFEVHNKTSGAGSTIAFGAGLQDITKLLSYASGANNYVYYVNNNNARFLANESSTTLSTDGTHTVGAGGIIQVAYDADSGKIFIGLNNTYIAEDGGSDGNPATGANPTKTLSTDIDYIPFVGVFNNIAIANFGQDSSFAGNKTAQGNTDGNGIGDFYYAPPSGFLALCTSNLPEPTISPNALTQAVNYFGTLTWTGNGTNDLSTNNIRSGDVSNGVGGEIDFKPDWTWVKSRSHGQNHNSYDSNRGAGIVLYPNLTNDEDDTSTYFTSFETNGFNLARAGGDTNLNNYTYVGWNWKVNGGTTSSVSGGTNITNGTSGNATVQANTTSGISIVTFQNTIRSTDFCTFPHGLGTTPDMIMLKSRDSANYWAINHSAVGLKLGFLGGDLGDDAFVSSTFWNTINDTTVKFQSNGNLAGTNEDIIAYCLHSVEGYSRFGSYTGNGSATDGTFVYTGFRPAFILYKNAGSTGDWELTDTVRNPDNDGTLVKLEPNNSGVDSSRDMDILSNGFKFRNGNSNGNTAHTYIYMAFAEDPFKYANAR